MPSEREWLKNAQEGERWVWLAGELDHLKQNQAEDFGRLNRHSKRFNAIEQRCAARRWQGKLIWGALMAAVASLVSAIMAAFRTA